MWKIILIILAVLYILNPFDLIPDLLAGLGWLDDAVVLGFLLRYLYVWQKKQKTFQKFNQDRQHTQYRTEDRAGYNKSKDDSRTESTSSRHADPYRILEIEENASQEEIKQAFRKLAGKYHPDRVEHLGEEFKILAEKRFKEIKRAYEELKQ